MKNEQPVCAKRMDDINPFYVMDILAKAKAMQAEGRSIIHMEVGEPDFETPQPIAEAGIKAIQAGRTHYTPALGLPELRRAISEDYLARFNVDIAPERIVITPGASGALQLLMGILVEAGHQVLMADPGYPCNRHMVRLFEGKSLNIPVDGRTHYQITTELLEKISTSNIDALLLASPANPTGGVINKQEMKALFTWAKDNQLAMIVDEIYQGLVYTDDIYSSLEISTDIFVVNSFSKYYGMTGWRVGWLVAPEAYIPVIDKLAQNIFLAASTPAQWAALAAFKPETLEILEQRRGIFKQRRDYLFPALKELGFDIEVIPDGAFYLYANVKKFTRDSYAFCLDILEKTGVAITPGKDFGTHHNNDYVRFAYTTDIKQLQEGVHRLADYLNGNR